MYSRLVSVAARPPARTDIAPELDGLNHGLASACVVIVKDAVQGARRVDLSNRGLKAWPEVNCKCTPFHPSHLLNADLKELFTLTQLKNIDA
eukprot:6481078-Amphidinium_carterae.1